MSGWPHSERDGGWPTPPLGGLRALAAALLLGAALALASSVAQAHKASDAYLFIDSEPGHSQLRWDIALRDLDAVLQIDADGDRQLRWAEVKAAWPRIDALALASLAIAGCRFEVVGHALEQRSDGAYAVLQMTAPCAVAGDARIDYRLFAGDDPTHRGILALREGADAARVRLLVPQVTPAMAPAAPPAATTAASGAEPPPPDAHAPASFLREGIHHILSGYDHLLFLLCLLLPAVLRRDAGGWRPVRGWREALGPVTLTVTLFTLAHSLTLALAATGWVRLSPSLIEPAIALTIMAAAFDNLRPRLWRFRYALTFGFGLIHGFGFAGVLAELQLPRGEFAWALLQFNLGLEAGQLALVLLVVPLLYRLRALRLYVPGVLRAGSLASLALAAVWCVERVTALQLLPA